MEKYLGSYAIRKFFGIVRVKFMLFGLKYISIEGKMTCILSKPPQDEIPHHIYLNY
jgi:hypothetical protein